MLRLQDSVDMGSFVQKHRDLIRTYNEMTGADASVADSSLGMDGKDRIGMAEAVDLICRNLSAEWEGFISNYQSMLDICVKEPTVETLEKALIIEEKKRNA